MKFKNHLFCSISTGKPRSREKFGKGTTVVWSTVGSKDGGMTVALPFKYRLDSDLASAASATSG